MDRKRAILESRHLDNLKVIIESLQNEQKGALAGTRILALKGQALWEKLENIRRYLRGKTAYEFREDLWIFGAENLMHGSYVVTDADVKALGIVFDKTELLGNPNEASSFSIDGVRKATKAVASTTLCRVTAAVVWADVPMRSAMMARTPRIGVSSPTGAAWAGAAGSAGAVASCPEVMRVPS